MKKYLSGKLKARERNLKYDFLPSILEIIERPVNRLVYIVFFAIIALIVTAVVWASLCKIDIAVTATGISEPQDGVITLETLYGGRVIEVFVEDGAKVSAGELILSLDSTEAELKVSECGYNLKVLQVQRDMYSKVYDSLCSENSALSIDTSVYGECSSIADAILLEKTLFEKELSNVMVWNEKERIKSEFCLNVLQNINELDIKINTAKANLQAAEIELEKMTVRALTDGTVNFVSYFDVGYTLSSGETVAYLLPDGKESIFKAYVKDEDISQIKEGNAVNIRIAAYNDTEYEYIKGSIFEISDVAFNVEGMGSVYVVKVKLDNIPENIRSGLEGTCDIVIGQRTVLDYFLEPFKEGLDNSLKER